MYILNIAKAIKKITLKEFLFENYHQRIGFAKGNSNYLTKHPKKKDLQLFTTKLTKKTTDPHNAK